MDSGSAVDVDFSKKTTAVERLVQGILYVTDRNNTRYVIVYLCISCINRTCMIIDLKYKCFSAYQDLSGLSISVGDYVITVTHAHLRN